MAKTHDGTPGLRKLTKLLRGAIDEQGRPDPSKRQKQVFVAFFDLLKSDEAHSREVWRFWFEQAYPAVSKDWVRSQKKSKAKTTAG